MKTILSALLATFGAAWGLTVAATDFPADSALLWIARQEGLYLTGLLSIACAR